MAASLRRKITLRCYITRSQDAVLENEREWHRLLYNAAIQERIDAWQKFGKSISYNEQQNSLPQLKKDMPELAELGSQALQETLRRVDRAFQAFYRRVRAGKTPGFPRFKSFKRFNSFTYPSPAGWSYIPTKGRKGFIRVGKLLLKVRGLSRFKSFDANDLTLKRISPATAQHPAVWEASITLRVSPEDCARERTGSEIRGFDQGLTDRIVFDNGETVDNTRLLRNKLDDLAELQQSRAKCKKYSRRYKSLTGAIAKLHRKVANQRKDENHKFTSKMVAQCELLATEALALANLIRAPKPKPELDADSVPTGHFLPNGAAAKAGLNREMQSAGMGAVLYMFSYKAEEASTRWHVGKTQKLKPTQRCAQCGTLVKKTLKERIHLCPHCHFCTTRDRNAALVCLIDALWPTFYDAASKKKDFFAVDGYAAFLRNRILYADDPDMRETLQESAHGIGVVSEETRETPAIA